ncbi:MAG TPA: TonB-dependent receptor [Terriglobales bacterium]|nr:TonB-dependent receptor [Terriglobales bacterium]
MLRAQLLPCLLILLLLSQAAVAAEPELGPGELSQLSLEQLMDVEVISASRSGKRRFEVADAIYVLTSEDIRRSGVTNIPDALRLVPGVQVARVDANKWAVGIRGFASRLARSVLVMIDRRSVYTPLFAGTYWEVQDLMLEDIDRIEVIRGPAGTLWGANAFNGVINIVTKSAAETQGGLVTAGGGNEELGFGAMRYGGQLGENTYYRAYTKYFERDGGFNPRGEPQFDDWRMARGGFRIDSTLENDDTLTFQGDGYAGRAGSRGSVIRFSEPFVTARNENTDLGGGNLLGRWRRYYSPTHDVMLQLYYDNTYRRELNFREQRHTGDLDFQHRFALPWSQQFVWGLGYRVTSDSTRLFSAIDFVPKGRTDHLLSSFLQDEIAIVEDHLWLTLGSKFEHNEYSGFEVQPSARILWMPHPDHSLWASFSRAVRSPARIESDVRFTSGPSQGVFPRIVGNPGFDAEKTLAYQAGYRVAPLPWIFVDTTVFYQHYDDLLSLEAGMPFPEQEPAPPHLVFPLNIKNGLHGDLHGVEVAADFELTEWWRLNLTYAYLQIELQRDPGGLDLFQEREERSAPHHTATAFSRINLPWQVACDAIFRYVDVLPTQATDSYVNLDARLAKTFAGRLEVSVVGQNLIEEQHQEFGTTFTEVERSGYVQARYFW